jgi:uncharacterized DUF497 family protein
MSKVSFDWDPNKADSNLSKHGVSFGEAATVFDDEHAVIEQDITHSVGEDRAAILGRSVNGRILVVIFTERDPETIRLISARLAGRKERRGYQQITGPGGNA